MLIQDTKVIYTHINTHTQRNRKISVEQNSPRLTEINNKKVKRMKSPGYFVDAWTT